MISTASPNTVLASLIEFFFAFALVYVVLNTATCERNDGNSYYGLAIGFTIVVGVSAGSSISGGVYNPAVALRISTMA